MDLFRSERTTSHITNSMNRSPVRRGLVLIALAFACFGLSPSARATCEEGCSGDDTFLGLDALLNHLGFANTAIGAFALTSDTFGGDNNTAIGFEALRSNETGSHNTATGSDALVFNDTGNDNTANGAAALVSNTTGNDNTATGASALLFNSSGHSNTANGVSALESNTTGSSNTATGFNALLNTTGSNNTATGASALQSNTTGSNNIAVGANAGTTLTTGSNNIDIGNAGRAGEANTIRIGKLGTQTAAYIIGISGATVPTGVAVIVDSSGHLGTTVSSERFKEEIQAMDKASEAIHALKPVTFRYKHELDPDGIPQFGLVAEEVEKVNPDLVARDTDGKAYTVRYEAVNAMLLNEFLKEHRKVEEQGAIIAKQQKQIEALTAGLQKVSAQVEMIRPAPQTVVDNH
jgi:endosialidase-like protein